MKLGYALAGVVAALVCSALFVPRLRSDHHSPLDIPGAIVRSLEGSLKRLKLERIDLYQLHAPDAKVPFADSVGALADGQTAMFTSTCTVRAASAALREGVVGKGVEETCPLTIA